jgi:hypothetical protein
VVVGVKNTVSGATATPSLCEYPVAGSEEVIPPEVDRNTALPIVSPENPVYIPSIRTSHLVAVNFVIIIPIAG